MTAVYAPSERELMRDLPVREQALVHTLKAFTQGEIQDRPVGVTGSPYSETRAVDLTPGHGTPGDSKSQPVYTDPEDLEFGKPKKTRPIYALVCTWKQSCRVPTKGEGEFWTKVWKLWYELKGWKVQSHDTGYFAVRPASDATLREGEGASKDGERHAILLHEYDKDSHKRLK